MTIRNALCLVALFVSCIAASPPAFAQDAEGADLDRPERPNWLDVELGKSIVIELDRTPKNVAVTNADVADAVQFGSVRTWQIQGRAIGSTDFVVNFGDGPPVIYEITVHRDLSDLIRRIDRIVGNSSLRIYPLDERIVVEGMVDDLDTLERVAGVAEIYDPEFINLMGVGGDHQVQLEVLFAEVTRNGTREMGINLLYLPRGLQLGLVDGTFLQDPATFAPLDLPTFQGPFNLLGQIGGGVNLLAAITLLDNYGLAKLIAQPTAVALSGQKTEFLSGGEIPLAVPNAMGMVTIRFHNYGTQLSFIPTVLSNGVIDIRMEMSLSEVDEGVAVRQAGVSVPGFSSRRVKGHVRLRDGETFAIAGLLSERITMSRDAVPGLGRIPVLGMFFRRITHFREERETLIYITPRIVRPLGPGEVPPVLGSTENNNPNDLAFFLLGLGHQPGSRTAQPTGEVGLHR